MEKTKPNTTKSGYPAWKWSGSILKGNISKGGDKKGKSKKKDKWEIIRYKQAKNESRKHYAREPARSTNLIRK